MKLVSWSKQLREIPAIVKDHPLMQDKISLLTLVIALVLNIGSLLIMLFKLHRTDYPVPIHYSSLVGFDQVGGWYQTYRLPAFGLAVTVLNGLLAAKSFRRNRLASFFLLIGAAVTGLLCLVIGTAFAVID